MRRVIVSTIVVLTVALLAFAYQDLMPGKSLLPELSHTKKLKLQYNATWKITAYCPGRCCNTRFTQNGIEDYTNSAAVGGLTLTGLLDAGVHVVAVDPSVIPLGSIIKYNNTYYVALDTGSAIKGFTLDILMPQHKEAGDFGVQYSDDVEVFIPENPGGVIEAIKAKAGVRKP
ncbi:MAG: 3D domain-containing protein [Spirochaetota bacterium]